MTNKRIHLDIIGMVQGIGFRPHVYGLAQQHQLTGYIQNSSAGVCMDLEGSVDQLNEFLAEFQESPPRQAVIHSLQITHLDAVNYKEFQITPSDKNTAPTTLILPDIATCAECLAEIFDPTNRRYRYPFTNCTHCGPRYSIITDLPYDRHHTSMKDFVMCQTCKDEYCNPTNRRFHAQPNACAICGPQLILWDTQRHTIAASNDAITRAATLIDQGQIVAVKGLGGFHLFVDAKNDQAVKELRKRKQRPDKAFALMVPDLPSARQLCYISDIEQQTLTRVETPIVLLRKRPAIQLSHDVAPYNPLLGLMLPYTPLHHILMQQLNRPLVATSANLSDEPICIDEHEAVHRLKNIADYFLVHDRPIIRPVDDSVLRVIDDQPVVIRRARGFAPLPIKIPDNAPCTLAVGGHLKNTVAYVHQGNAFLSQHVGDLDGVESLHTFQNAVTDFQNIYKSKPSLIACDLHPDYASTRHALKQNKPILAVQHHHAHIIACMAENQIRDRVLGLAFDGTGLGTDHTIWGGEFLLCTAKEFTRVANLHPFLLPCGDTASREPRRSALGLLHALSANFAHEYADLKSLQSFSDKELKIIPQMLAQNIQCVKTSSLGRLFDGVASILNLVQFNHFEGQGAMSLEFAINDQTCDEYYSYKILHHQYRLIADWRETLRELIADVRSNTSRELIATKFHNTIVELSVDIAVRINEPRIALSGGCFQNAYLTQRLSRRLKQQGFAVYRHQNIPPNDGGIALGQAVCAIARNTSNIQNH